MPQANLLVPFFQKAQMIALFINTVFFNYGMYILFFKDIMLLHT